MKKLWYNWSKPKKIISIISMCLCLVLLGGCFVNTFVNIEDGKVAVDLGGVGDKIAGAVGLSKTRNSQNILDPEYYTDLIEGKQNGVKVTVNEDGSITLDGKATSETKLELYRAPDADCDARVFTVGSIDYGKSSKNSDFYMEHSETLGDSFAIPANTGMTFTFTESDSNDCVLSLRLAKGDSFDNVTVYPTLNYGYVAQPFYEKADTIDNLFGKDRNASNILDPEYYEDIAGEHSGVDVTVNDDGSITLDGKATASFELKLFENEYFNPTMFCVGTAEFGEEAPGTHFNYGIYGLDIWSVPVGYEFPFVFDPSSGNMTFYISVFSGDEFDNVTIYPVLNYGVTAVSYFE